MSSEYRFSQVFAAACICLLFFGVGVTTLGSILPSVIAKYQLTDIEAGALTSLLPVGILIGSLVFGPVVDRYSYRHLLIICLLVIALGLEGIAFTEGYGWLQLSVFLIGLGGGAINGGGSALVVDISTAQPGRGSANLSLLGVFFGIGALGMPGLLGLLTRFYPFERIVATIGGAVFLSLFYLAAIRFPAPKQTQGFPLKKGVKMLTELPLLLIGFTLFFQSGVEGLVNSWTPTFLQNARGTAPDQALFALSLSVGGLTAGRLVLAGLLRKISSSRIIGGSLLLSITGCLILLTVDSYALSVAGLVILGAGLAAGFPVMLGYAGNLYADLSGTAFSLAFTIALLGNTIINFLMGVVANGFGIGRFPVLMLACLAIQGGLLLIGLRRMEGKA